VTHIPEFEAGDKPAAISSAFEEAGAVVIHKAQDESQISAVKKELQPFMEAAPMGEDDPEAFYPANTRRVTALIARAPSTHPIALHSTVNSVVADHLGSNCETYHLHVTAALEIGPGARSQILHRESDPFEYFPVPRPNLVMSAMWALTDFRKENGATFIVPGSHKWEAGRTAEPDEILNAEMPAGSVLLWTGGTLHAAAANVSQDWRYGIIMSYGLGWLRQEENMFLDTPKSIANNLPEEIRDLLGYKMHGSLGFSDPTVDG
jgi:ectoine hydroxylase-related dioxygenase (phytanoyl-CoA dioxygenase family)